MRSFLRAFLKKYAYKRQIPLAEQELTRSAVVFSPHQDDETLGCGGTIVEKRRAGAQVTIVFMTDGSSSHSSFISPEALCEIRRKEAVAAGKELGLEVKDILFLDFPDGQLGQHIAPAVDRVSDILCRLSPAQVFVPYRLEPPPDHYHTNQVVLSAIQQVNFHGTVYEYPIWFWYHWPWVSLNLKERNSARQILKNTLLSKFGLQLLWDFHTSFDITDHLSQKRTALNQHKSQMTRLLPGSAWPVLEDVSGGEFLECFFQERELFRKYEVVKGGE